MTRQSTVFLSLIASAVLGACSGGSPGSVSARSAAPAPAPASAPSPSGGATAQELPAGGTWLNAGGATSLASLRGQVVYVQFAFLG